MISFTGSTATGRQVMAAAAPTLKKVFLELGGKSAAVVLDDYDIAAAAALTAFTACIHAGQGCALTTRLIVPRASYDEAVAACAQTMRGVTVGDPADPATSAGPVISAAQRDRIESYLRRPRPTAAGSPAAAAGRPGGRRGTGSSRPSSAAWTTARGRLGKRSSDRYWWCCRTTATTTPSRSPTTRRTGCPAPCSAPTWTGPGSVAARMRTGTVGINGGVWYGPDVPFGGYKQSGVGREMGTAGFEEYLEIKAVARSRHEQMDMNLADLVARDRRRRCRTGARWSATASG